MGQLLDYAGPEQRVRPNRWGEAITSGVIVFGTAALGAVLLVAGLMLGLFVFGVWG